MTDPSLHFCPSGKQVVLDPTTEPWIAQSTRAPTQETYESFHEAFRLYNIELFGGMLPDCLITLQRRKRTNGYFCLQRFVNKSGTLTDEIALNPMYFAERTDI